MSCGTVARPSSPEKVNVFACNSIYISGYCPLLVESLPTHRRMLNLWLLLLITDRIYRCDAWLLLAAPQSSSTSTMSQLGQMASIRGLQEFPCPQMPGGRCFNAKVCYPRSSVWYPIATTHSDVCEHSASRIESWVTSKTTIFKQHVPPTPHNKALVLKFAQKHSKRVLILTRNPYNALHGLCERALRNHNMDTVGPATLPFPAGSTDPRTSMSQMLAAFQAWDAGWEIFARDHPEYAMLITYEQMSVNGNREPVLSSALDFLRLAKVKPMQPVHARYVHANSARCDNLLVPPAPAASPQPVLPSPSAQGASPLPPATPSMQPPPDILSVVHGYHKPPSQLQTPQLSSPSSLLPSQTSPPPKQRPSAMQQSMVSPPVRLPPVGLSLPPPSPPLPPPPLLPPLPPLQALLPTQLPTQLVPTHLPTQLPSSKAAPLPPPPSTARHSSVPDPLPLTSPSSPSSPPSVSPLTRLYSPLLSVVPDLPKATPSVYPPLHPRPQPPPLHPPPKLPPLHPPPRSPFRMLALWGSSDNPSRGICIASLTATRAPDGTRVAAQCCTVSGECRRSVSSSDGDCIAGNLRDPGFVEMTFDQAQGACAARGLLMCERSCVDEGCSYNKGYVWTGLRCPSQLPPLSSSRPSPRHCPHHHRHYRGIRLR